MGLGVFWSDDRTSTRCFSLNLPIVPALLRFRKIVLVVFFSLSRVRKEEKNWKKIWSDDLAGKSSFTFLPWTFFLPRRSFFGAGFCPEDFRGQSQRFVCPEDFDLQGRQGRKKIFLPGRFFGQVWGIWKFFFSKIPTVEGPKTRIFGRITSAWTSRLFSPEVYFSLHGCPKPQKNFGQVQGRGKIFRAGLQGRRAKACLPWSWFLPESSCPENSCPEVLPEKFFQTLMAGKGWCPL